MRKFFVMQVYTFWIYWRVQMMGNIISLVAAEVKWVKL